MIQSTSNEKIKQVRQLLSSAKARREQGLFVIEGEKLFCEAPSSAIEAVYITEDFQGKASREAREKLSLFGHFDTVSDHLFQKITDTVTPQGIVCVLKGGSAPFEEALRKTAEKHCRFLILEGIQDPGNLGTMLRTAEAAGYQWVIADGKTADLYNPKVIRSTMGAIFRVGFSCVNSLSAAVERLKERGVCLYAAHLKGKENYDAIRYADKTALLIGNESRGLSDEISSFADILVKIPMQGKTESLNAAVAAAILMYQSR